MNKRSFDDSLESALHLLHTKPILLVNKNKEKKMEITIDKDKETGKYRVSGSVAITPEYFNDKLLIILMSQVRVFPDELSIWKRLKKLFFGINEVMIKEEMNYCIERYEDGYVLNDTYPILIQKMMTNYENGEYITYELYDVSYIKLTEEYVNHYNKIIKSLNKPDPFFIKIKSK